jgi:hypothetical protein
MRQPLTLNHLGQLHKAINLIKNNHHSDIKDKKAIKPPTEPTTRENSNCNNVKSTIVFSARYLMCF